MSPTRWICRLRCSARPTRPHSCTELQRGQHSGGMVITRAPLAERVPIEPARMPGRVVVQWDKDALEAAGLIKIDILGLRMLSAISEAVALIAQTTGQAPDLDHLTFDDKAVFDLIERADTIGRLAVARCWP